MDKKSQKKILVVDDAADIVDVVKTLLMTSGYDVITAFDGAAGYELAAAQKPDLIILDILMPKMDGYTFVKRKKYDQSIKDIPVIILTGKAEMEDLFTLEGIKDYLVKPFDSKQLLALVNKYLK
ncbi:MAG: response regulator [Candidatus Omnitrophica bacterium]|nr:response regulator [Candidatus Omnitrophota bacterium]